MTHTPGEWKASRDTNTWGMEGWRIDADSISMLAWLPDGWDDMDEEIADNACLIAAAPDLYEACTMQSDPHAPFGPDVLYSIANILERQGHTMKANWLRTKADLERAAITKATEGVRLRQ